MRRTNGFTLIELLVVVGIVAICAAMALPAISHVVRGQKLAQAGRMVAAVFSQARGAAIATRCRHYVFVGRIQGTAGEPDTYALAIYRKGGRVAGNGTAWDTQIVRFPSSVQPVFATEDDYTTPIRGSALRVQDWTNGLPSSNAPRVQVDATRTPGATIPFASVNVDNTLDPQTATYEFEKDGTVVPIHGAISPPPPLAPDLYDEQVGVGVVPAATAADFVFKQVGDPSRRCFVSVDGNTGRVRFRVVETLAQ